jgi:ribonucleotide reductase beta subunit family protein with ferritin-like domain
MSIKMSLDTPALERLFKDDKELEIQLKQGVIMNFVHGHMTDLLKDEFLQKQIKEIKESITKSIKEIVQKEIGTLKNSWGTNYLELNSDFKQAIKHNVSSEVNTVIADLVYKSIAEKVQTTEIEKYIAKSVANKITDLTREEVQKRASEILKKI